MGKKDETVNEETGEILSAEEAIEETTEELVSETLAGDLRDHILDLIRNQQKPWQQLSENEQRDLAYNIEARAKGLIRSAVRLIASDGRKVVMGELEKVTIKDAYQCVINVAKHSELRHAIADSAGSTVLLVVSNDEEYLGERGPVDIEPDQADLLDEDKPVADYANNIPQEAITEAA